MKNRQDDKNKEKNINDQQNDWYEDFKTYSDKITKYKIAMKYDSEFAKKYNEEKKRYTSLNLSGKAFREFRFFLDWLWSIYWLFYLTIYQPHLYFLHQEHWSEQPVKNMIELEDLYNEIYLQEQTHYKNLFKKELEFLENTILFQQRYLYTIILEKNYIEEQLKLQETTLNRKLNSSLKLYETRIKMAKFLKYLKLK